MHRSLLLDLLRIFAISLVLIAHLGQLLNTSAGNFFGLKNFYFVSLGGVGVTLFLVLSGILAELVSRPRHQVFPAYLLKKILRIYPLYWITIPVSMIGYMTGHWLINGQFPELFPNGVVIDLLLSLSGLYSWFGLWGGPYNSPSWFIALIISMYALFPLIHFLISRHPHATLFALLIVSVLSRYYVGQHGIPFMEHSVLQDVKGWLFRLYGFMPGRPVDWFPPCRLFEFGLGVYLAHIIPSKLWFYISSKRQPAVSFFSDISFALFLVHYPFLFLVVAGNNAGLSSEISIALYLTVMILTAWQLNRLDQRFPRNIFLKQPIGARNTTVVTPDKIHQL